MASSCSSSPQSGDGTFHRQSSFSSSRGIYIMSSHGSRTSPFYRNDTTPSISVPSYSSSHIGSSRFTPILPTSIHLIPVSSLHQDLSRLSAGLYLFDHIDDQSTNDRDSDPWWIFTALNLFWNIKYRYEFKYLELIRISPRFAVLLLSMTLSIIFIIIDLFAVTSVLHIGYINPFWKFAFIFKCFTDTIVLDDFKTALDKLSRYKMEQNYPLPFSRPGSQTNIEPQRSSIADFAVICPVESSALVTVEHLERAHTDSISSPPRAVRASQTGLGGRPY